MILIDTNKMMMKLVMNVKKFYQLDDEYRNMRETTKENFRKNSWKAGLGLAHLAEIKTWEIFAG